MVAGTRTPIWILHDYYVLYERDMAQMLEHFPHLTPEQILGALDYYARCPERVDEDRATQRQAWERLTGRPWPG